MRVYIFIVLLFALQICSAKNRSHILESNHNDNDIENLVTQILQNSLLEYRCVVFICDEVYHKILSEKLFKSFGEYISYFMIYVKENDDLLSPENETKHALEMAKRQGCQMYVITIANGVQASRFLMFGDKYRLLDTRANYTMLYDKRLFSKELLYLWKRIVNVIFIRKHIGTKVSGDKKILIPWFEISTVPFPSPIKGVFVPRRVEIWRQTKFSGGGKFFKDKTTDLRNQTLHVVAFQHIPATTKILHPELRKIRAIMGQGPMYFSGLEVEILATISKAMNFNPKIYEPENSDLVKWGEKQSDGQYSGLFGEIVRSRADIALGDLYYTPFILEQMDLTIPYNTECLTFLTPESLTDNSWKTLILPFQLDMWVAVFICLFLSGIIFYLLAKFHHQFNKEEEEVTKLDLTVFKKKKVINLPLEWYVNKQDPLMKYAFMKNQFKVIKREGEPEGLYLFANIMNSFLYTTSMLLMVSLPKLPTGWSLRILTGWYWLYCLLVVVSYRASMTAILANPAPRVTIDSLQELVDSQLSCGSWSDINREFFKTSLDPLSQIIGSKFELVNDSDSAIDRVAEGEFAFYENVYFLKHSSVKRQLRVQMLQSNLNSNDTRPISSDSAKENRNLHIMSNCVINMPISIGLQKNSPIKLKADKLIRKVLEAGLVKKWLDDVMQKTLTSDVSDSEESTKALMSMEKLYGAGVQLLVGYGLSFLALFGELAYFNFYVKRHPHYDKYSRKILKPTLTNMLKLEFKIWD